MIPITPCKFYTKTLYVPHIIPNLRVFDRRKKRLSSVEFLIPSYTLSFSLFSLCSLFVYIFFHIILGDIIHCHREPLADILRLFG